MFADALLYSKYRKMTIRDTEIFLSSIIRKMDWSREEEDVMMDIGCGPGISCRERFLSSFPKMKKLIAFDVLPGMIEYAKNNNTHEKIEYHLADIEDRCSIEVWAEKISKIVSIYCFNALRNLENGFRNVYYVLKPGGEAAIFILHSTPFWDSFPEHIDSPKWGKYLKNAKTYIPESQYKNYEASYYENLLKGLGFNVLVCKIEDRKFAFGSDEEGQNFFFSICGLCNYIPNELKEEFKEDLYQGFLKYGGRSSDGSPVYIYKTLSLLIQKPKV